MNETARQQNELVKIGHGEFFKAPSRTPESATLVEEIVVTLEMHGTRTNASGAATDVSAPRSRR